jgi:XRE family aerobic/anaerobic benzoate catabolism transcriptional regulator
MQRVIAQGDTRPMAENRESMADLRRILSVREPLYGEADIAVETSGRSLGESFDALLKATQVTAGQESAR